MLFRLARLLTTALIAGSAIGLTLTFVGPGEALGLVPSSPSHDWEAYWNAAERLLRGEPLYPPVADPGSADTYRYPPWFAVAWTPLTFLPRDLVGVGWVVAMFLAGGIALQPLLVSRYRPAVLLGVLLAPFLAQAAIHGNVQPAIVAALVRGVDRRHGPAAIGVAGSLKLFPLVYVVTYASRRQWRNAALSLVVAAVLVAPMAFIDLTHYPVSPGPLAGLWLLHPLAWLVAAVLAVVVAFRLARSESGWFAASVAVVLAMPRLLYYDLTFLLVTGRWLLGRGEFRSQ